MDAARPLAARAPDQRPADCTETQWRAYASERRYQVSRDTAAITYVRLTDLWTFDQLSARPAGITPPWETEGVDEFRPAAGTAAGGENTKEPLDPLDPLVLGPLLIWATRFVDDFADDILAASDDGTERQHLIHSRHYKHVTDDDGNHISAGEVRQVPWVAITPVVHAIRVLERMVPAEELLLSTAHHEFHSSHGHRGALKKNTMAKRIESFVSWVNREPRRRSCPASASPTIPTARSDWGVSDGLLPGTSLGVPDTTADPAAATPSAPTPTLASFANAPTSSTSSPPTLPARSASACGPTPTGSAKPPTPTTARRTPLRPSHEPAAPGRARPHP
ncbi:hypothetical protein ACFVU4_03190 [Streptomyces sp. NPDC058107]|uniref:hypothetical protein n=1 Tax=Streptomyces sp. NPDC058107 TaxID=3346343 RepID=UPI0036E1F38F